MDPTDTHTHIHTDTHTHTHTYIHICTETHLICGILVGFIALHPQIKNSAVIFAAMKVLEQI